MLTAVLLLSAADGAYEAARRVTGKRLRVSGTDAALGAFALRDAALAVAGPSGREIPGFGSLVAFAVLGGLAAPGLRRTAQRMRAASSGCAPPRIGCAASASGATGRAAASEPSRRRGERAA